MTAFRDFFRRRRVARHVAKHGWAFECHGLKIRLPEGTDATVASALLRGKYETEEMRMIHNHLPKDRPVIELGGSLGVVSAVIGDHLNADTPHLVVEANPHLQAICLENAQSPQKSQALKLVQNAVSYGGDTVAFQVAKNPHASGLSLRSEADGLETVNVPSITLEALHQALENPEDFSLVCDIEGGEADILARDHATVAKAGVVIMELHPAITPQAAEQIPQQMIDLGFSLKDQAGDVYTWSRL